MQARSKGLAILLATLLLGMVLGGLLHGYVQRERFRDALRLARPPQLVADIERAVQPRDDGQREAIRDILQATMQRMQQQRQADQSQLRATIDSMEASLLPLLDESQQIRLQEHLSGPRTLMPPPRGHRGPPRRAVPR
jgi:hypothetical protein